MVISSRNTGPSITFVCVLSELCSSLCLGMNYLLGYMKFSTFLQDFNLCMSGWCCIVLHMTASESDAKKIVLGRGYFK